MGLEEPSCWVCKTTQIKKLSISEFGDVYVHFWPYVTGGFGSISLNWGHVSRETRCEGARRFQMFFVPFINRSAAPKFHKIASNASSDSVGVNCVIGPNNIALKTTS